jgi:uncharacterized membrane protein YhiD involved in acid resistance
VSLTLNTFNLMAFNPTLLMATQGVLLAFIVGTVLAFTYIKTFEGLSYSKSFIQSLVLSPIVSAIAMQAIDGSLARGIGMMGAFSILRFRSNLKDPKDMFFLFASLSLGIASGVHAYSVALSGGLCFCAVIFILANTPFTQTTQYDGLLRFNIPTNQLAQDEVDKILKLNCKRFALITLKDAAQGNRVDYAYQVKLKNEDQKTQLINDLQKVNSMGGLQLLLQKATVDI